MSRRTSRKSDTKVLEIDLATPTSTPKKGRKAVKIETTEAATTIQKTSPAKSKKKVKAELESDEEIIEAPKRKINSVKAKVTVEKEAPKPKKAPAKRKAKTEDDEDEGADVDENKSKKKRKTKEEKEAEAMPIAARTAIGALKKAMHIGAHVSGAGGMSQSLLSRKHY
jgi:AP endonuclease-1